MTLLVIFEALVGANAIWETTVERVNSKIHTAGQWITILFMGLRFEGVKYRTFL